MATKMPDMEQISREIGEATGELGKVQRDIEEARLQAATGGTGLMDGLMKLREREAVLENRLVTLRRVRDDLSAQDQHAQRERRRVRFSELKATAKTEQARQDKAQAEFTKACFEWLRTFLQLQDAHRVAERLDSEYRPLRREFDDHGPGHLVQEVDFPHISLNGVETIPLIRMACRDGVALPSSIRSSIEVALGGKRQ